MDGPHMAYLKTGELPEDKTKAIILSVKARSYVIYDDKQCRRGYSVPFLRYITPSEANYIMRGIHKGICENHVGGQSLAFKALR